MVQKSMIDILKKLNNILTKQDKKFIKLLIALSIFVSIIEMIGISAIMPFIAVSSDFSLITSNIYYKVVYDFFQFNNEINFVVSFGVALVFFYFLRSAINLFYGYMQARFTHGRYYLIVYRLFENYMGMSYKNFVTKNSSTLTKSIVNEASGLTALINAFLIIFGEIFVMLLIYSMMLYVSYKITLVLTILLLLNAILLIKTISKKIKQTGKLRASIQKKFYEIINKTFGNFKLIKLQNNDEKIINEFSSASSEFANANIIYATLGHFPRLFLEAIGFGIIVSIITFFIWENQTDIKSILPVISMFVLALYRLMPSVNRIMTSYNQILFHHKSLDIIHNDLVYDSELLGNKKIDLNYNIKLENIKFEYNIKKPILKNININIIKNDKIAFIGESGSGKSTLVDIIMGLHKPVQGNILIDDVVLSDDNIKDWRSKIGYIPQNVYLFDGTVAENIVFGREYKEKRILEVLKQANIYEYILSYDGLDTLVGEGGVMLSGGQKQRIAIARALYDNPEILVLDEATSALDSETESKIMDEIYNISEDKTLIIIAHRLSTIERCEKIYKIRDGEIENV
ncbi:wlab protein [Sulfurimonas gotlandica GD1]|nr:ABC transporter ATP-binding protein [Sulfurimonas gotlandica]EDZ62444.1 wlab protein [Sulfurimonas gotlandica GD1]